MKPIRAMALVTAAVVVAGVAYVKQDEQPSAVEVCTPKPALMDRGTELASGAGTFVHSLSEPLPMDRIVTTIRSGWFTLGYWTGVFGAAVDGRPTPVAKPAPVDCSTALAACISPQGLGGIADGPDEAIVKTAIRIAQERGLPERAMVIILAAGMQESAGIHNLDYGDRDSVGWLQQRAGWGSVAQRMDPAYAASKFYDALVKVDGWETMSVTEAAQAVQISGYPDAYAQWQDEAEALVAKFATTTTTPDKPVCSAGPATAGTWNVLQSNSTGQINAGAGFADLVGLQEIRANSALRVPGYEVTEGRMAVPIIWRPDRLDLVTWERETVLRGYRRDKSAVWGIWRNRATGQSFAAINTHMLVEGGRGWLEQAAAVNRIRARLEGQGLPVVMLGDMNAPASKVAAVFGGQQSGRRIDFIIGHGATPGPAETLSKFGSDHARVRVAFPQTAADSGAVPPHIRGGSAPSRFDQQGNPRTVEEAVAWMQRADAADGADGEQVSNRCERYMNLAYGLPGGYPTARGHWSAPGPRTVGMSTPPRGALVFWDTSNSAGHVALSVGGGRVISTDYNAATGQFQTGMISEGPIGDLDKWGGRLGWRAPNFKMGSES